MRALVIMSLADHLRWLMAPDRSRWKPMLMGLALSAAAAGAAVLFQPSPISAVLLALALAAWFVGAYGMVGYARWFFASEIAQARRDNADMIEKKNR
jgi:hypothetical protein